MPEPILPPTREPATAHPQLERILYILPAAQNDGVAVSSVAGWLGVTPSVFTGDELRRPVRLSPRETLVVHLGLRVLVADSNRARRADLLELAGRLEGQLAVAPPDAFQPRYTLDEGDAAGDGVRGFLQIAARDRRRCRIRYLKPGEELRDREICPYALLFGSGRWYVVGRCEERTPCASFEWIGSWRWRRGRGRSTCRRSSIPQDCVTDAGRVYRSEGKSRPPFGTPPEVTRWVAERGR